MIIGSDVKVNISLDGLPSGVYLSQTEFTCIFYVIPEKSITLTKSKMSQVDNDNYTASFNTKSLGSLGTILAVIKVILPDGRTEILEASTGIVLTPSPVKFT